jgi:hypothetical protein
MYGLKFAFKEVIESLIPCTISPGRGMLSLNGPQGV